MLIYFKDNDILFNLNGITNIEIILDTDGHYYLNIAENVRNRYGRFLLKDKEEGLLILNKILCAYNANQKVLEL
jgi:hypothetical protein